MHDPMTVAFEIPVPFTGRKNDAGGWEEYPKTLIRIWHVDPEKDGSDDSCGWFIRARHADQKILEDIKKSFRFEYEYLFTDNGSPKFSPQAITLHLFRRAAYQHFNDWKKVDRYIKDHLHDLLHFAENPVDSLLGTINETTKNAIQDEQKWNLLAVIIYPYILRDLRPWYKSPRWHIWHWKIQVPLIQNLQRWLFSRCAGCGKGFKFGESPTSMSWTSEGPRWFRSERGIYHSHCIPAPKMVQATDDTGKVGSLQ